MGCNNMMVFQFFLSLALVLVNRSLSFVPHPSRRNSARATVRRATKNIGDMSRHIWLNDFHGGHQSLQKSKLFKIKPALRAGDSITIGDINDNDNDIDNNMVIVDGTPTKNDGHNKKGVIYMALSALSFSLMFLGVKLYSEAPTFTLIFYRSIVQAVLSILLIAFKKVDKSKNSSVAVSSPSTSAHDNNDDIWEIRKLLVLRGTFGSAAVGAFFYAIQHLPLPDAITLQFTTPVFAAILAVPLLGEKWARSDQMGAVVCLVGVVLMARPSWLFGASATTAIAATNSIIPTVVGLLGAALAALAYILVRKIGDRADANTMVLYYAIISGLTAPFGARLLSGGGGGGSSSSSWDVLGYPTPTELLVFAGLGVFGFLGQLCTNKGLTKCDSAATATLVTNSQIVFAFLFEVTVLHESLSAWSLAGTALIAGYMVFVGIFKMTHEKQD